MRSITKQPTFVEGLDCIHCVSSCRHPVAARPDLSVSGADPGEGVGKDSKQSTIAQARMRGRVHSVQKRFEFTFDERGRMPSVLLF
jgi:hypothetical protein